MRVQIRDINTFGVYVLTDSLPPVGARVQMEIMLPTLTDTGSGMHLQGEGVVLRREPRWFSRRGLQTELDLPLQCSFIPRQRQRCFRIWRLPGTLSKPGAHALAPKTHFFE